MTEFESAVAEALAQHLRVLDGAHNLASGELGERLAPHVAAAIAAEADPWCLERRPEGGWYVEHCTDASRNFGPYDLTEALRKRTELASATRKDAALAALKGSAP